MTCRSWRRRSVSRSPPPSIRACLHAPETPCGGVYTLLTPVGFVPLRVALHVQGRYRRGRVCKGELRAWVGQSRGIGGGGHCRAEPRWASCIPSSRLYLHRLFLGCPCRGFSRRGAELSAGRGYLGSIPPLSLWACLRPRRRPEVAVIAFFFLAGMTNGGSPLAIDNRPTSVWPRGERLSARGEHPPWETPHVPIGQR